MAIFAIMALFEKELARSAKVMVAKIIIDSLEELIGGGCLASVESMY